jgi:acyl-CoA thioesterase FadM
MSAYQFPVEPGAVLLFTRAAGGPEHPADADIPVPPTFVQSSSQFDPNWPFRPRPGHAWLGSGRTSSGDPRAGNGSILHAEQHFTYYRPVRAATVLTVTSHPGQTWVKSSRGGGELHFEEAVTEYRDEAGELLVTARSVAVTPKPTPTPTPTASAAESSRSSR